MHRTERVIQLQAANHWGSISAGSAELFSSAWFGDEKTQDGLPDNWRNLDDVSVGKKFDQVRANVLRIRGVGGARIYENNADLFFL